MINKDGTGFAVLHYFTFATNDGGNSVSALLQASDGELYGTAQYGGAAPFGGDGVVFRMDLSGSNFTILHSFKGPDGNAPQSALVEGTNGFLFGTTLDGGSNSYGTIFRLDKSGSNFTVIHHFPGTNDDGHEPYANVWKGPDGRLYGTTTAGGMHNQGVLFGLDYDGGNYAILHHFGAANDGTQPYAGVVTGPDGALYGTTDFGGAGFYGTIYQVSADGSGYVTLVQLFNTNGLQLNPLILGSDGAFYGTANGGGPLGSGTVFKLTGAVAPSDANVLNPPVSLGSTGWRISGHGLPNRTYTVEFTPSLAPPILWSNLGPATADVSGNWQLNDLSNPPGRFFRTRYP
jgi:uncharacterized repeat protein (TIGR03803 family)